jgi:hypothetical protein
MVEIERKAAFYLGKLVDAQTGTLRDEPVLYDARDLTTHAVCIGMTGSGKTGLGIDLLEEATLDGLPSIVIDPKGDMTNLLLTFPELRPEDFAPWINKDDASRKGMTVDAFANKTANDWREGLAAWGEDGARIQRLRDAAEFVIYTPGSDAGVPVSVLRSFQAPPLDWDDQVEAARELVAGTVSGLLGLLSIEADPVRSREHILLSHILEHTWRQGHDLEMVDLIRYIQEPPIDKVGVFAVDTFFPAKERFQLAMSLNNIMAAPSFQSWIQGVPLDIGTIIQTPSGKPRVAIFYIAHLNDAERMFFVTMLLERVLAWMRQLSGTTSLRCLLYFDEIFGFFPPYPANPPSKTPLLTLLKMARAFGLGLVLTTQNPVDLDYKGLTNAGTWFIGKLQTDRDKARVLEGMEGVVAQAGTLLDRRFLDRMISSLSSRNFILHNVHEKEPVLLSTRWAMSYLRGPLTRSQVRDLMKDTPSLAQAAAVPSSASATKTTSIADSQATPAALWPERLTPVQPRVNTRVAQYALPVEVPQSKARRTLLDRLPSEPTIRDVRLVYQPYLVGLAAVTYADAACAQTQELAAVAPLPATHGLVDWEAHWVEGLSAADLTTPEENALYDTLPEGMTDSPPYTALRDNLIDHIYRQQRLPLWEHAQLKLRSEIGETERAFKVRCQEESRRQRDAELAAVKARFAKDLKRLTDKLKAEQRELENDTIDHEGFKRDEMLSAGESVLSVLMGRKRSSALSQASRRRRMTAKAKADVRESEESIADLEQQIAALEKEQEAALEQVREAWSDEALAVTETALRPKKTDIRVEAFGLAWAPFWLFLCEQPAGGVQEEWVAAYQ